MPGLLAVRRMLGTSALAGLAMFAACSCASDPTGTSVRERWFGEHEGISWAGPIVVGDLVYFGSGDGKIYARNVATGTVRWVTDADAGRVEGANFVERDGVVAVATMFQTVALNAATGQILWRYAAPRDTALGSYGGPGVVSKTHLAIDDNHVYVPAWGASISAVDRRTGAVRWVWLAGRAASDTAAAGRFRSGASGVRLSGDTIFGLVWHDLIPTGVRTEAWLLALDRRTGRELWRTTLPNPRGGATLTAPTLAERVVVFAASSGRIAAVDRATGRPAWNFEPPLVLSPTSTAAADADAVYADGGDGFLRAFDPATGAVKWQSAFETQATADLAVSERRVYVPVGGYLHIFDRRTGRRVAKLEQPGPGVPRSLFASAVAVARGRVFANVSGGAWSFYEP